MQVWDLQEGLLFYTLHGHESPTLAANFSSSGQHFASAGADAAVLVWKTNFDACLGSAVAAVAVPAKAAGAGGSGSVKQQAAAAGHQAGSRPQARKVAARPKTAPCRPADPAQQQQQQQLLNWDKGAEGSIAAVHRGQGARAQDGSHAAAESLEGGVMQESLTGVLQQAVSQLDMLTQTVAVLEERVTMGEDRSARLEAALAQLTSKAVPSPVEEAGGAAAGAAGQQEASQETHQHSSDVVEHPKIPEQYD